MNETYPLPGAYFGSNIMSETRDNTINTREAPPNTKASNKNADGIWWEARERGAGAQPSVVHSGIKNEMKQHTAETTKEEQK